MKNNKGFTLVEIISVIGILLLVATITVPSVISIRNKNNDKNYDKIINTIITAAENYIHNKSDMNYLTSCYVTLEELASNNLLKTPISNPNTKEDFDMATYVKVDKISNGCQVEYKYNYINNSNYTGLEQCPKKTSDGISNFYKPNAPELASGMIPVIYDEVNDTWIKANTSLEWYNYSEQIWANAVTVTSTNRTKYLNAKAGTEISMNDINSMWVWIPRYKYKIPSEIGRTSNVDNPPLIDIIFESGTDTTGATETVYKEAIRTAINGDGKNTLYYTHPAFTFGNEKLTGIWVSKFLLGGTKSTPLIKPDIVSIKNVEYLVDLFEATLKFSGGKMNTTTGNISFSGNTVYGLTNTTDTHMIKNTDWGAIAYLYNSQYGKKGNCNYTDNEKRIYYNYSGEYNTNPLRTGRSNGNYSSYNKNGKFITTLYSYNDRLCTSHIADTCDGEKVTNSGTGASTTGNIYGVYDVVHSPSEYLMGVSSYEYSSNENPNDYFNVLPNSKYYDYYDFGSNSNTTYSIDIAILGDATIETEYWENNTGAGINNSYFRWASRGHTYSNDQSIFICGGGGGAVKDSISTHAVLIP